jgi:hypothetical protein
MTLPTRRRDTSIRSAASRPPAPARVNGKRSDFRSAASDPRYGSLLRKGTMLWQKYDSLIIKS